MWTESCRNRQLLEMYRDIIPGGWKLLDISEGDNYWQITFGETILSPSTIMFVIQIGKFELNKLLQWGHLNLTYRLYLRVIQFLREQLSCRRPV